MFSKDAKFHQALGNKFNRKKTLANDKKRISSLYQNNLIINNKIHIDLSTENNMDTNYDLQTLFGAHDIKIYNTKPSVNINMTDTTNSDENIKIPKIISQEIIIPTQSMHDSYDLNTINKHINQNITMDITNDTTMDKDNFNTNVNILYLKKVYIINNVYQELYFDNKKPTGLGDFIRGCYFLLQFCEKYKFKPNIIINHPIAFFLEKFEKSYNKNIFNSNIFYSISNFSDSNLIETEVDNDGYIISEHKSKSTMLNFINYLCKLNVFYNNIFMYNILFPYKEVEEKHKFYMRTLLEPNEEMKMFVNETMIKIGIKGKYNVIHIRSGDIYLTEEIKFFDSKYYKKIYNEISSIVNKNNSIQYLLLADNNKIKQLLCKSFPNLKAVYYNITHLGENKVLERQNVKNTMLDFYLLALSSSIFSFSCYIHGSGFSLWCAQTYNIPYKCKLIKNEIN